jgi:hypothetical protein
MVEPAAVRTYEGHVMCEDVADPRIDDRQVSTRNEIPSRVKHENDRNRERREHDGHRRGR